MTHVEARRRVWTEARRANIGIAVGGGLVAFYILFPLDRGFPRLSLFGHPLSSAVVASLVALLLTENLLRWKGRSRFRDKYVIFQTALLAVMVLSSLATPSPLSALQRSGVYYCTFAVNYIVLRSVVQHDTRGCLSTVVAIAGVVAAGIGLLQGLLGWIPAAYSGWWESYYATEQRDYAGEAFRVSGTLNNPILFGLAMVLLIPFATTLPRWWQQVGAIALYVMAAALTASRTVLLVLLVQGFGAIVIRRRRAVKTAIVIVLVAIAGMRLLMSVESAGSPRVGYLMERVGLREGMNAYFARRNLADRREALEEGLREMAKERNAWRWLFGRGPFSSSALGEKVSASYNTVDNVFMGIAYEGGLAGIGLFLGAFTVFLLGSADRAASTLHWWAPVGLLSAGVSFNWDAYSTFNILVVGSMAITASKSSLGCRRTRVAASPTVMGEAGGRGKTEQRQGESTQCKVVCGKALKEMKQTIEGRLRAEDGVASKQ